MTAHELREALAGVPDNTQVIITVNRRYADAEPQRLRQIDRVDRNLGFIEVVCTETKG
jgi:hypothetical protein